MAEPGPGWKFKAGRLKKKRSERNVHSSNSKIAISFILLPPLS